MDFLTYYGLTEEPFRITPDAAYFFASGSHHSALLSLAYSTDHREGFSLVAGEPGTGKTTLLNVFLEKYRDKAEIAMVLTPRLSPEEFLLAVLEDFRIRCSGSSKNEIIRTFRDFLIRKSGEGKIVIILVDEAQNLPDETLEELRLLSNLETEKEKLLHIILVGQPEIVDRLKSPQLRQLFQRIVTVAYLKPLDKREVGEYISFRLTKAGRGHVRFRDTAVRKIYQYSKGIPRLINTITTRSLMSAFLEESGEVQPTHVGFAAKSLKFEQDSFTRQFVMRPVFAAALALAALLSLSYLGILQSYLDMTTRSAYAGVNTEAVTGSLARSSRQSRHPAEAAVEPMTESYPAANRLSPPPASEAGEEEVEAVAEVGDFPDALPVAGHEIQETAERLTAFVTAHAANVREAPGFSGRRIDYVSSGQKIHLLNETAEVDGVLWYRMDMDHWDSAWISSKVLRVVSAGGG